MYRKPLSFLAGLLAAAILLASCAHYSKSLSSPIPFARDDKPYSIAIMNLNMRFRSRDAYKAAFMNDFAFIDLGKKLAVKVSELRGEEVELGRFVDQSDSYHLYGSYFREFFDGFLKLLFERKDFNDRTWTKEFAEPFFEEARPMIRKKIEEQDEKLGK